MREKSIYVDSKLSSGTVESRIEVSRDLKKYFKCLNFYSSYDAEIVPSDGVLNIPVLSIVLPFAWITGADVYVDKLDETFAKSMNALQSVYKKTYPKAPFKTSIIANNLVKGKDIPNDTALLFSGGVDSTYSLYSNIALHPRLVMIFGVMDIPISNVGFQDRIRAEYSAFAKREGLDINFIRTNALEIMDRSRLRHLWGKFQGSHEGDFWNGIGYSLGQIGQAAPLSVGRFNHLLVSAASTFKSIRECPVASAPDTDEKIAWANFSVKHDGLHHRHEKVTSLKELLNDDRVNLRVCWSRPEILYPYTSLNCGRCEKCLRTIAALAYAGVDPNRCGFNVDESTFTLMKFLFEEKLLTQNHIDLWWKPLQQALTDEVEADFFGSKQFFEWFKAKKLDSMGKSNRILLHSLYFKFPYFRVKYFKKIYNSIVPSKYEIH